MPIYEYECLACGKLHEIVQRHTDLPLLECSSCGGNMRKLISQSSFVLKGTGWYKTDYASSDKNSPKESEKTGTATATAEGKVDAKAEGKTDTNAGSNSETKTETAVKT